MKYVLITNSNNSTYANIICEYLSETHGNHNPHIVLHAKSLINMKTGCTKIGDVLIFSNRYDSWKDVTGVYNKIMQLHKKTNSLTVHSILTRFEKGQYPTKTEFGFMNRLHLNKKNKKTWKK